MARQPTSMIGHMYAAARSTVSIVAAPVMFVGRATMQAAERLIPQGAAELGNAIFTGNAYAPPGLTERLTDRGNVHGTGAGQQQAAAPVQQVAKPVMSPAHPTQAAGPETSHAKHSSLYIATQSPTPVSETSHAQHASTYYTPNTPSPSYNARLEQAASRVPNRSNERGRER